MQAIVDIDKLAKHPKSEYSRQTCAHTPLLRSHAVPDWLACTGEMAFFGLSVKRGAAVVADIVILGRPLLFDLLREFDPPNVDPNVNPMCALMRPIMLLFA